MGGKDGEEQKPAVAQELAVAVAVGKKEPPDEGPPAQPIKTECKEEALEEAPDKAQGSAEAGAEPAPEGVVKVEKKEGGGGSGGKAPSTKGSGAPQDSDSSATCSADEVDEPEGGDKNRTAQGNSVAALKEHVVWSGRQALNGVQMQVFHTDLCPAGHPLSLGLHDSTRPVLPRPPTISNPPPLISSSKHPSVLDRQGLSVQLHIPYSEHAKVPVGPLAMGLAPALDPKKLAPFSSVKQEQLSPRGQAGPPESLGVPTAQETSVLRGTTLGSVSGGSISKGVPSPCLYRGGNKLAVSLMGKLRPGERKPLTSTRFVPRGTPADVLYKGTITRIMGEDSPSRLDRGREDGLPKGHVIYEGKKGHVLSYDGGMSVSKEDGRSSSGPAHETAAPKRTYDMMEGRVGRAIASGSIEGLMGRAIPPERHSPHHLKEQHHIRGSITQVRSGPTGSHPSSKAAQDRKLTSTPREIAKSPHSAVPEHHPHPLSPYEHLLRGVSGVDLYRGHIPLAFDPAAIPRGIPLDAAAAAYYLPRHLAPNPTYPHLYPPYLIRGYPETAALENRQTIINDYITSQQMHHNAATAMAQHEHAQQRGTDPGPASCRMGSKSPGNTGQPPAFFSKLTESTSAMVKSKKQEINKKLGTHNRNEPEYNIGQPGTEIFNMPAITVAGLMTCRSQALPEQASTNLGLEAIIRKALMGKYDQWEEPPLGANAFNALNASAGLPAAMPITAADGPASPEPRLRVRQLSVWGQGLRTEGGDRVRSYDQRWTASRSERDAGTAVQAAPGVHADGFSRVPVAVTRRFTPRLKALGLQQTAERSASGGRTPGADVASSSGATELPPRFPGCA
ncbi:PREDICTED: nuclear receptor corepressor 2 [Myotis davidii]|uniref:nuclear receptor corepressor 2 n=1 Tax=Myotis davidii TaxID=225400 RepID=UPI0007676818|nr:PREDICTED: nuclear receptor corepressor 2 [Myotis davidii]